jgi:putative membrane protein
MFFGPLIMILVLAAIVAAVLFLVRQTTTPSHPAPSGRTALDVLKERFARGEIDKDEFEERRRVLGE